MFFKIFLSHQTYLEWMRAYSVTTSYKVSIGCYADSTTGQIRDLALNIPVSPMTIETCIQACRTLGYSYAGAQAGYIVFFYKKLIFNFDPHNNH